jgi:hypothetical protein
MENWKAILSLEFDLDQAAGFLTSLPEGVVIAGVVLPFVLAILSRRLLAALAALLLGLLTYVIILKPAYKTPALAISGYLGSLLIAFVALRSWREDRARRAEFAALQNELDELRQAEERRMFTELRSAKSFTQENPVTPPP